MRSLSTTAARTAASAPERHRLPPTMKVTARPVPGDVVASFSSSREANSQLPSFCCGNPKQVCSQTYAVPTPLRRHDAMRARMEVADREVYVGREGVVKQGVGDRDLSGDAREVQRPGGQFRDTRIQLDPKNLR